MGALLYAVRRLPEAISRCRHVVMGQSPQGFKAVLGADILGWEALKAPARRRRWYFDGKTTLAVLIASTSDIDDLVPTLVAYQIEWNKLHAALQDVELSDEQARIAAGATEDDWRRLHESWGDGFDENLATIKREECRIVLRLVGGSHLGYARNASRWWLPIAAAMDEMGVRDAPIYFVSSNAHSLINVLTGVAASSTPRSGTGSTATSPSWTRSGASSRQDTAAHHPRTGFTTALATSLTFPRIANASASAAPRWRRRMASGTSRREAPASTRPRRCSRSAARPWINRQAGGKGRRKQVARLGGVHPQRRLPARHGGVSPSLRQVAEQSAGSRHLRDGQGSDTERRRR